MLNAVYFCELWKRSSVLVSHTHNNPHSASHCALRAWRCPLCCTMSDYWCGWCWFECPRRKCLFFSCVYFSLKQTQNNRYGYRSETDFYYRYLYLFAVFTAHPGMQHDYRLICYNWALSSPPKVSHKLTTQNRVGQAFL